MQIRVNLLIRESIAGTKGHLYAFASLLKSSIYAVLRLCDIGLKMRLISLKFVTQVYLSFKGDHTESLPVFTQKFSTFQHHLTHTEEHVIYANV